MANLQQLRDQAHEILAAARRRWALVDIGVATFQRFSADDGGSYAAALTYYAFFSVFPLLLFAASIVGYVTADDAPLVKEALDTVPILGRALEPSALETVIENRQEIALTGLGLALYSGSGAVVALEHALNKLHKIEREPGFVAKRVRSLKWLAVLGLLSLLGVAAGSVAGSAEAWLGGGALVTVAVTAGALIVAVLINTLGFATAYRFLPAVRQTWNDVVPGAVVAAILFQGLNIGGAAYLAHGETSRNATFGTFAAAATLLVASYLIAQITLLAAEVNLVLRDRKQRAAME